MSTSRFVTLKHDPSAVVFGKDFEIEDEFLHSFFDSIPAADRNDMFLKALKFGAYALKEQEIGQFLNYVENELDIRLHELKLLYQTRTLKEKGAAKGVVVEADIRTVLMDFIESSGWSDKVAPTGAKPGVLPKRKVGDIVTSLDGSSAKVVIESKWDDSYSLGEPTDRTSNPEGTAYGQNLTALINREAEVSIFVADWNHAHATVRGASDGILFHPEIPGFVALVDRNAGDWTNLKVAYGVARSLALHSASSISPAERTDRTLLVVKRVIRDLNEVLAIEKSLDSIMTSTNEIGKAVETIRSHFDRAMTSAKRSENLLRRVLAHEEIAEVEWKHFLDEAEP